MNLFVSRILIIVLLSISIISFTYADDNTYTVNIPTSSGVYLPIVVKKSGGRYFGPLGECYADFPTVKQLQINYDGYSLEQIQEANQDMALKNKMLLEQGQRNVDAARQQGNKQSIKAVSLPVQPNASQESQTQQGFSSIGDPFIILFRIIGLIFLWRALKAGKKRWLLDHLPISKTIGACVGVVRLEGTAEVEKPLVSKVSQNKCVYYRWWVSENWTRYVKENYEEAGRQKTRMVKKEGSDIIASGSDSTMFYLKDHYGAIQINPRWANYDAKQMFYKTCGPGDPLYYKCASKSEVDGSTHERTLYEEGIAIHSSIYLEGYAQPRQDIAAAEVTTSGLSSLLISTNSKDYHKGKSNSRFWWLSFWGLLFYSCLTLSWDILGFILIWAIGVSILAYNNLISLGQSVDKGLANVEVHLKRRYDLLGNLITVVTALRDYENQIQQRITLLRGQLEIINLEGNQDALTACLPAMKAIAETYPNLKTSAGFIDLQERIKDAEDRIALTRDYYNEIATSYNKCLKIVPYQFISRRISINPRTLIAAGDFERVAIPLNFAV